MARVTEADVRAVIDTSLDSASVTSLIDVASTTIDNLFADETVTEAVLTEIERWMAAHFIQLREQGNLRKEKLGDGEDEYLQGGEGFESTTYGQTAVAMDPTGALKATQSDIPAALFEVF